MNIDYTDKSKAIQAETALQSAGIATEFIPNTLLKSPMSTCLVHRVRVSDRDAERATAALARNGIT
jgi:hypothetical protein